MTITIYWPQKSTENTNIVLQGRSAITQLSENQNHDTCQKAPKLLLDDRWPQD